MTDNLGSLMSLRDKARDWAREVVSLHNQKVPAALVPEKAKLMATAQKIKKGIESIFGSIDELNNVGLAVLPLVPVAAIGVSAAAIYKWNRDYKKFKEKLEYHKKLTSEVGAERASKIISETTGGKGLISFPKVNKWVYIIGGAGLAYYFFVKKKQ